MGINLKDAVVIFDEVSGIWILSLLAPAARALLLEPLLLVVVTVQMMVAAFYVATAVPLRVYDLSIKFS